MSILSEYIALVEANKIVKGITTKTGVPVDHVQQVWNAVDKEVVAKHIHGNTDKYKEIGTIVKAKMGIPSAKEPDKELDDQE